MDAPVSLRPARADDAPFLMQLRNAPDVVRASREQRIVTEDEHGRWLAASLTSSTRRLFVVVGDDGPIGQARLDLVGGDEWVSIALVGASRGRGYGLATLRAVQEQAHHDLMAEIRVDNEPSRRAFARAGFCHVTTDQGFVTMRWPLPATHAAPQEVRA